MPRGPKGKNDRLLHGHVFTLNHASGDMQFFRGSGNHCARHACHALIQAETGQ